MTGARSKSPERGVAAVEAAIITPLILLLIFAIIEGGLYAYSYLTVQDATTDAARQGSISRDAVDADEQILAAISDRSGILRRASIDRIVIYQAESVASDPPVACTSGPIGPMAGERCSVYSPADLDAAPGSLTCGWCGPDREARDLLGVWISFNYVSVTGAFDTLSFTERSILPIEPDL